MIAKAATWTDAAPQPLSTAAHSRTVAPVVTTSSTKQMLLPAILPDSGPAENAAAALRARSSDRNELCGRPPLTRRNATLSMTVRHVNAMPTAMSAA